MLALILVGSLVPLALTAYPPLQDLPDWAYQARIAADLVSGTGGAEDFAFVHAPVPNAVATLAMTLLGAAMSPAAAAKTLAVFTAAFFAFAWVRFVRANNDRPAPAAEVLGAFFAVGHFFWMGYLGFQLGVAVLLFSLSLVPNEERAWTARETAIFGALFALAYFCHFLAFGALIVLLFGHVFWRHGFSPRAFVRPLVALSPSALLAIAYAASRAGEFGYWYRYGNVLKWAWYKAGPFAPLGGFYPATPGVLQGTFAFVNALFLFAFFVLTLLLLVRALREFSSPYLPGLAVLLLFGWFGPTRLFEVIRPGERWLYVAVLVLAGTVRWRLLARPIAGVLSGFLVVCALVNGVTAFHAGLSVRRLVDAVRLSVKGGEPILSVTDSHFHFREERHFLEKAADPYSYPNWVNSHKLAPLWHLAETRPVPVPEMFPSGIIRQREHGLESINTLDALADPAMTKGYGAFVASGLPENLNEIENAARQSFRGPVLRGPRFIVIAR
ncbi:hypothetical protein K8I61_03140 [bacterium]|nr:hypothetical protein [bacterium]